MTSLGNPTRKRGLLHIFLNGRLTHWGLLSLVVVDLVKDPCGKDL